MMPWLCPWTHTQLLIGGVLLLVAGFLTAVCLIAYLVVKPEAHAPKP